MNRYRMKIAEKSRSRCGGNGRRHEKTAGYTVRATGGGEPCAAAHGIRTRIFGILMALACAALLLTACSGAAGQQAYLPALEVEGDVEQTLTLTPSADGTVQGCESQTFTDDGKSYRGISLRDVLDKAGLCTGKSAVYLKGGDGMIAGAEYSELDTNYLVFGSNGWEAVSPGFPPSLNVKGISCIVVVADDPAQVAASVKVTDENGTVRTISPGTLFLRTQTSELDMQGQSEKNGRQVSVYLTDNYVRVGDQKLTLDGNKIKVEKAES